MITGKTATVLLAALLLLSAAALAEDTPEQPKEQTICPIVGGKINKNLYVDTKEHRIFVCRPGCLAAVKADPEKAIQKIRANGEEPMRLPTPTKCAACEAAGGMCAVCAAKTVAEIDTAALAVLIRSGAPLVVLDARTGKFDDGRRIPGAKSLAPDATAEQAAALIPQKDSLVVTYCTNLKCPASSMLAKRLRELAYTNIIEYPKGIEGWAAAGQKIEAVEKK